MAALAEAAPAPTTTPTPAAVGCHRSGCLARGTACHSCLSRGQRVALTDGQAAFILRTKLAAACVAGDAFESAWALATAEVIARSAQGQARSWRVALEAVRGEYAEAYRRKRLALTQPAARLA